MAEEKPTETVEEVEIISEDETQLLDENLEPYDAVIVTWRYRDYPPVVTIIRKEEYSEEKLKEIIKKEIEKLKQKKRRTLRL